MRGLVAGALVCTAAAAHADGRFGPAPLWDIGAEVRRDVTPDAGTLQSFVPGSATGPLAVRAVLFYVDSVAAAGDVSLVATLPDAGQQIATVSVSAPGWVEWSFTPPLEVVGPTIFEHRTTSAHVTLLHLPHTEWNIQVGGDQWPLGTFTDVPVSAVLRLANAVDPLALPSCSPADRDAVLGFPYVHLRQVPFDGGALTQRFAWPRPITPSSVPPDLPVTVHGGQAWTTANAPYDWEVTVTGLDGGSQSACYGQPCTDTYSFTTNFGVTPQGSMEPFQVSVRPPADAGLSWHMLDTGLTPDECHPAARATFGGSRARAEGEPPGADFLLRLSWSLASRCYRDADNDGWGDPAVSDYAWNVPDGWRHVAGDCDDSDWTVSPSTDGELCDGRDNDCDGLVDADDDGLLLTACEQTLGVCARAMHQPSDCRDGGWLQCPAARYPPDFEPLETRCDHLDNDCDGEVDSDAVAALCALQRGVCAGARAAACHATPGECEAAAYGPNFETRETQCDGLDNDCDGLLDGDDDVPATACELQAGVCRGATHASSQCTDAGWMACGPAEYGPRFEQDETACDGFDNDCDGEVDEPCPHPVVIDTPVNKPGCGCTTVDGPLFALLALVALAARRRRAPLVLSLVALSAAAEPRIAIELLAPSWPDSSRMRILDDGSYPLTADGTGYLLQYVAWGEGSRLLRLSRTGHPLSVTALPFESPVQSPLRCVAGRCAVLFDGGVHEVIADADGGWQVSLLATTPAIALIPVFDGWIADGWRPDGGSLLRLSLDGGARVIARPAQLRWDCMLAASPSVIAASCPGDPAQAWIIRPDGGLAGPTSITRAAAHRPDLERLALRCRGIGRLSRLHLLGCDHVRRGPQPSDLGGVPSHPVGDDDPAGDTPGQPVSLEQLLAVQRPPAGARCAGRGARVLLRTLRAAHGRANR